ncbi:MAG: HPP family protein [Nitrospiria bacterium]
MERRLAFRFGGKGMKDMAVSHMMKRDVISFGKEIYCNILAESMLKGGFGSIPIIDHQRRLIGIVSEYDLLNALTKGMDLRETLAFEVMTQPAVTIKEEMPIEEVILLLQSQHFIRVPVVDPEGKLIGIVARRDILGCYVKSSFGPLPGFKHDV